MDITHLLKEKKRESGGRLKEGGERKYRMIEAPIHGYHNIVSLM